MKTRLNPEINMKPIAHKSHSPAEANSARTARVPEGAVRLNVWIRREARRVGLTVGAIQNRLQLKFYQGIEFFRLNARRVWVVRPGVCRKPVTSQQRAKTREQRKRSLHNFSNGTVAGPDAKYYAKFGEFWDEGGRTAIRGSGI